MRDIKFRVIDSKTKEDISGCCSIIADSGNIACIDTRYSGLSSEECKSLFTLMQFTGLQDKKKKDAYEADIIQTFYDDGQKGDVGYLECTNLGSLCLVVKGKRVQIPLYVYDSWEIIGNIYQDKELLN